MATDVKPGQRYRHGWIPLYPAIHKSDLSTPDARRSREVSPQEFDKVAAVGAAQYEQLRRASSTADGIAPGKKWDKIVKAAYTEAMKSWGGVTIDSHTGKFVKDDDDKYALTVRDAGMRTTSIPEGASFEDFTKAMNLAKLRYAHILERKDHHLGVFHDDDKGTIDFDPVLVTGDKSNVETIGAYTHAVGGAYHFKSGDGFWPPHVKDENG